MKTRIGIIAMLCVGLFKVSGCNSEYPTAPKNNPPIISSLFATPIKIELLDSSLVICNASDPDGDEMTYVWQALSGTISGFGDTVIWIPPKSAGTYFISCKVVDKYGGKDFKSVDIKAGHTVMNKPFTPDSNTIALWHFNENDGQVANDSSANSFSGFLENGVAWDADGKFGSCVSFNYKGFAGQRIRIKDAPGLDINNEFTIDAWIYLSPRNDQSIIASKWNTSTASPMGQYYFGIRSSHLLYFACANNVEYFCLYDEVALPFNQWLMVSAVFDNGKVGLFVNAVLVASDQAPFIGLTDFEYPNDDFCIGDFWGEDYFPYTFEGKIDEVRLSNVARYEIDK